MQLALENNYYAFSAHEEMTAVVKVISGGLEYSNQTSGPFRSAGSLARGESRTFTQPTVVAAYEKTVFDVDYPPPPSEGPTPEIIEAPEPGD